MLHYYAPDEAWLISELLPAAFVTAFGRGDNLTVRNAKGEAVMSFGVQGSAKAARTVHQVFGFTAASATAASATAAPDSWSAMSTTAVAITGDIRISAEEIQFENGATLRLAVTDHPRVFRVVGQANPVRKNENLLCGREPPTFVVFGHDENTESLAGSSVFYEEPVADCARYDRLIAEARRGAA